MAAVVQPVDEKVQYQTFAANAPPMRPSGPVVPDEQHVRTLVSMGFDDSQVRAALRTAHNNVDAAMNHLLDQA